MPNKKEAEEEEHPFHFRYQFPINLINDRSGEGARVLISRHP
jgi:hypothetical protein